DLLGHGRSASSTDGYDIPTQARRVGAALDRLGAGRVAVIGHSTGGTVATALAEQRPDAVAAPARIDPGPTPGAYTSQSPPAPPALAGSATWAAAVAPANRGHRPQGHGTAFTRPIDIPDAIIEDTLGMTHRAVAGTARASLDYLVPHRQRARDRDVVQRCRG